jgi:uncharacterized membrane protein
MRFLLWLHLIGAAVWLGGMVVVAAVMPTIRRAGGDDAMVAAVARTFGRVSWVAMVLSGATGVAMLWNVRTGFRDTDFAVGIAVKLLAVGLAVGLALWHQTSARTLSARVRRAIQVLILVATLGAYAAAVAI